MGNYILEKSDYTFLMKNGIRSINKKKSKNFMQIHKDIKKAQKQYNKYHKESS